MVFPPWFENLQVKYLNRALKPIARFLPGTATIEHRGRTSGKPYKTIVTTYRKGNVLAIALGHGKTDWVKNVLAAGQADVHFARRDRAHHQSPDPAGRFRRHGPARVGAVAVAPDGGFGRRYRLTSRRGGVQCALGLRVCLRAQFGRFRRPGRTSTP